MTIPNDPNNTAPDTGAQADTLRYTDALEELRTILRSIEDEQVDLDALSVQVERAAFLIRTCRSRIRSTELKIRSVLDELEQEEKGS